MEAKVSEVLENILGMLSLEGSFDVEEKEEGVFVSIDTQEAGKLIGHQGETLSALQYLVNLMVSKQVEDSKRVIIDVSGWRQSKEEELAHRARYWANQVLESGRPMELDPMPSWQRRIVHLTIESTPGVKSESMGEGLDRHLVISPEGDGALQLDSEEAATIQEDTAEEAETAQEEAANEESAAEEDNEASAEKDKE
jgi:spoIIIJ-associated protein